ncbi:hypothetical protein [Cribrihabitans neustonicus]|uniref:hypothetical protein n=1 Tax=Cribrihabitans neustonicus TaxID=1429085 RepID=UPI003B5A875B
MFPPERVGETELNDFRVVVFIWAQKLIHALSNFKYSGQLEATDEVLVQIVRPLPVGLEDGTIRPSNEGLALQASNRLLNSYLTGAVVNSV